MKINRSKSLLIEIAVVALLLTAIIWLRAYKLDADPPIGLSSSSDVYTDPPNLTLYAKQKAIFGEFTPLGDERFVLFLKSTITLVGTVIFKNFGTGIVTSNLIGLIFSIGALLLFFLIVRKVANPLAGIFYLLLIGLNYNQLFYGRLPFQEHAMAFWGFLAMVLLLYSQNRIITVLAGLSLGLGIFFGKIIGIAFLFPFGCYFLYRIFFEKDKSQKSRFLYFAAGFTAITLFWLFYAYLPMKSEVGSYVGEHVYSLYGFPEGLQSIDNFIRKYLTFGLNSHLFYRMKTGAIFSAVFLGMISYFLICFKSRKDKDPRINGGFIFIAALIVGFIAFLMIWNYRPLRYQLVLIYPICAATAIIFSMLWHKWRKAIKEKFPAKMYFVIIPLAGIFIYNLYKEISELNKDGFSYNQQKYYVFIITAVISYLIFILIKLYKKGKIPRIPLLGKVIVVLFLGLTATLSWTQYNFWKERPTFCTRDNSTDLKKILNPDAVITGPYSSVLTLENEYRTIIHMFGVSNPDLDFFKKFPVTHLMLDRGNEARARKDYPEMMDSSTHILTYHIGKKKVRLFRIAGHTGNPVADSYKPSLFEQLVGEYNEGKGRVNNKLAVEFLTKYPDNITCYAFLAEAAERDRIYDLAESMFKKAVEFSPSNYDLTGRLAKFYHDRFDETGDLEYKEKGLFYYNMAIWVSPVTSGLYASRQKLENAR